MAAPRSNARGATIVMIGFWLAAGCAGRPFEYHSQNEIPAGAGIFSGALAEGTPEDADAKAALVNDFETFQRWKRDPRNASEYQEFIEWRIWNARRAGDARKRENP